MPELKTNRPACSIKCSQIATRMRIDLFLNSIPKLKCACGCGQLAPIHKRTYSKRGIFKGQPARFIFGHSFNKNLTVWERFLQFVDKKESPPCWIWIGSRNPKGYGLFHVGNGRHTRHAHIVFYEMKHGSVPNGFPL